MPQRPILFFPGVLASRLYFVTTGEYWDPDSYRRMWHWIPGVFRSNDDNRRELDFRNEAHVIREPVGSEPHSEYLGWGGVVWSYYKNYLRNLYQIAENNYAYAFGYDWRQSLRWLGMYARDRIEYALSETGADKVNIIAHSMGGLVVRAALRTKPELAERIDKLLFICQPAAGAVVLYRRLFTGLDSDYDDGFVFRWLLGNEREAFVGNMSGMPGPLQLLPTEHFPQHSDGAWWHSGLANGLAFPSLYRNANSPPGVIGAASHSNSAVRAEFAARIDETMAALEFLGPPEVPAGINAWQFAGDSLDTDVLIDFDANGEPRPGRQTRGDGTVPLTSSTAMRNAQTTLFDNLEHANACNADAVWNETVGIMT